MPAAARLPTIGGAPVLTPESPRSGPAPQHRGLSLRPRDAIDPYALGRFAPDHVGVSQLSTWCPHCNGSLLVVNYTMTDAGLYIEGVCQSCSNPAGARPGIYKRLVIPLAWGTLPDVEE